MPGQDSNATERRALLGSRALARWNLRKVFPSGRQVRGKTRIVVDRSAGQTAETPCGASHTKRSIAVRVRPPRNSWPGHSYYQNERNQCIDEVADRELAV